MLIISKANYLGGDKVEENGYMMILQQFGMLTHQMFHSLSRQMANLHVSAEAPVLLHIIEKHGPLTQREIADKMKIKPATLTVRLQRLERLEYVIRENDPNDKRIQRVSISKKGSEVTNGCYEAFSHVAKHAFDGFSEEEVKNLLHSIQRMNENIENLKAKGKE